MSTVPELPDTITSGAAVEDVTPYTVEQVLEMARRPEKTASVCLRADLQARYDALTDELKTLVDDAGFVIVADSEASLGEKTATARAIEIDEALKVLRAEMSTAMWTVTFRAMASDEWDVFQKAHRPAHNDGPGWPEYYDLLVSKTAVSPEITAEKFAALRAKLSPPQILTLIQTAYATCLSGGVDAPKLPDFSLNLEGQHSEA